MDGMSARRARFAAKPASPGLISRGDTTLIDKSAQLEYWQLICRQCPQEFEDIVDQYRGGEWDNTRIEPDSMLVALRKLRQAVLATNSGLEEIFKVSVEISARMGRHETYVPCILHLMMPEYIVYLVLHMVHFTNRVDEALSLYFKYLQGNQYKYLLEIIQAWVNDHWILWFYHFSEAKGAVHKIMNFGKRKMVNTMQKAMTKAYFQYPVSCLPRGVCVEELGWKLSDDGATAIIRQR